VREFKIQKSKLKPLLVGYRDSLARLKDALKESSGQKDEEEEGEAVVGIDGKKDTRPEKRKHLKERSGKYLKRIKQGH